VTLKSAKCARNDAIIYIIEGQIFLDLTMPKQLTIPTKVGSTPSNPIHKKVPTYFTPTSRSELITNEQEQVLTNLKANWCPDRLLRKCLNNKTKPRQSQERALGFAVLPYVKGASNRLGCVLQKFHI